MSKKNKDPFVGYVPYGPEWQAYMMKRPKALIVEVATGIVDKRDQLLRQRDEAVRLLNEAGLFIASGPMHNWHKLTEIRTFLDTLTK